MKKIILKLTLVAAFVVYAGYSLYTSWVNEELSDLALANIEALAGGESGKKHTLDCGKSGIKACSATCNKCNVTITLYGNGRTATLTCYQ